MFPNSMSDNELSDDDDHLHLVADKNYSRHQNKQRNLSFTGRSSRDRDCHELSSEEKQQLLNLVSALLFMSQATYYMLFPVLPAIIMKLTGDPGSAAVTYTALTSMSKGLQLLAAPFLGTLADVWGKRTILLQSLFITGFASLLMAFTPNYWGLFVAHVILGLGHVTKPMCYAVVADLTETCGHNSNGQGTAAHGEVSRSTTAARRATAFGQMGAAASAAMAAGPCLGAAVTAYWAPEYVLGLSALLHLAGYAAAHCSALPRAAPRCAKGPDAHVAHRFSGCCPRLPFKDRELGVATACYLTAFACVATAYGMYGIWYIYTQARYGWGETENALFLAAYGAAAGLAQGPGLRRWLGPEDSLGRQGREDRAAVAGLAASALLFVGWGAAPGGAALAGWLPVAAPAALADPILRARLALLACAEDQGTLQGFLYSTATLGAIAGSALASLLFAASLALGGGDAGEEGGGEEESAAGALLGGGALPWYVGAGLFAAAAAALAVNARYGAVRFVELTGSPKEALRRALAHRSETDIMLAAREKRRRQEQGQGQQQPGGGGAGPLHHRGGGGGGAAGLGGGVGEGAAAVPDEQSSLLLYV